jgi:PPM family protein phosphatase
MTKNQHPALCSLLLDTGKSTDNGAVRRHNEDSILTMEFNLSGGNGMISAGLFAVADGVGGNEGGEIASSAALRVLSSCVIKALTAPSFMMRKNGLPPKTVLKILQKSAQAANREVFKKAVYFKNDMGTTLACALVTGSTTSIVNVGDSRVYVYNGKTLEQITKDHSLVAALAAAGEITPDEIYPHPRRNIITRCLGMHPEMEIDQFTREIRPGEALIICSDGLWEMVHDGELSDIIGGARSAQSACDKLVAAANRNGGLDNISVVIVKAMGQNDNIKTR